jgi:hypothetical protein
MVDRVAKYALGEQHKKEWSDLNVRLGKAAEKRGRIAHYSIDFEWIDDPSAPPDHLTFGELGKPRLQARN